MSLYIISEVNPASGRCEDVLHGDIHLDYEDARDAVAMARSDTIDGRGTYVVFELRQVWPCPHCDGPMSDYSWCPRCLHHYDDERNHGVQASVDNNGGSSS